MTQEINISKILEEFDEMGGCFAAISKDSILHADSARGWLKGRLIELLDAIPCEERKNKTIFDSAIYDPFKATIDNGYNKHCQETKSIIEQLKK